MSRRLSLVGLLTTGIAAKRDKERAHLAKITGTAPW